MNQSERRKYLITGGAGFIGSHLCDRLINAGHTVVVIDDLSTGRFENIQHLISHPKFKFVRETIMNELVMDRLTSETDVIIHLAAAVGVNLIVEDPVRTMRTNIYGSEMVLNTANRYGCKVLITSSSELYGKNMNVPFKEDDDTIMGPTTNSRWAYATSKSIDEFMGLSYHRQYGLPVIILRLFNTIGPRQTGQYGMVVPRFVQAALRNEPLQVYGDGQQTRTFTDVVDVTRAIDHLSVAPQAVGEVVNVGANREISILDLAKLIIDLCKSSSEITIVPYEEAYGTGFEDMQRRVPSLEKINNLISYTPEFTLRETIKKVINFEIEKLKDKI